MSSTPKTFAGHPNLTPHPNTGARPKLSARYTYPSPSQNPRHPQQPITDKILADVAALERRISETIPLLSRQQQTGSSPNIPVHTTPGSYYSMPILTREQPHPSYPKRNIRTPTCNGQYSPSPVHMMPSHHIKNVPIFTG